MPDDAAGDVLFEFTVVGNVVKAVAIDATSGVEVSVLGPVQAARSDLQRLALGKLRARLAAENR
jgi:hypothetical protein